MTYILREDGIERLSFSTRTYNCLRRAGVETVGQLLDFPPERWPEVHSLGQKSRQEIVQRVDQLRSGGGPYVLTDVRPETGQPRRPEPERFSLPVERLGLSPRAVNCLKGAEIHTLRELMGETERSLKQIPRMGTKTLQEVLDKLEELAWEWRTDAQSSGDARAERLGRLAEEFAQFLPISRRELLRMAAACQEACPDGNACAVAEQLYRQDAVRTAARKALTELLEKRQEGMSRAALLAALPGRPGPEVLDGLLEELLRREAVSCQGELVTRRYPTALEFVQTLSNQRERDMLLARLEGETLESVGQRYHVTRERVRQITARALEHRPRLREDRYRDMFDRYEFTREDFFLSFDEPPETYEYLEMLRPRRERRPLAELLEDESVSVADRRRVERAVYKRFVTLDGARVERSRPALARYVVQTRCQEMTTMDEFMQRYRELLESIGLEGEASLTIDARTYENKLSACGYVLWSQWHRFRYYPIRQREYGPLLEELELEQYEDLEISARKLFRDSPALMEEYDVRDEYELHNLLKKIWPESGRSGRVQFKKMPTIEIGTPDRDQQVKDLLLEYAPISNTELAQRYEERYGARSATVLANYFSCIDRYLYNGVYRIDRPHLAPEQRERLLQVLDGDFYRFAELRRIYQREFPGEKLERLNAYTLKDLGFHVYGDYVVGGRFSGAADYFRSVLLGDGISDLREMGKRLAGLPSYAALLMKMKGAREIVEFSPNQYISQARLQEGGVAPEDLEGFCAAVRRQVKPGEYFTVASLRREGFTDPLEDTGFDDWFYGSLLAEDRDRFSCRRMGGTRVFFCGKKEVYLIDFLRWVVEPEGHWDLYDLKEYLEEHYGVALPTEKIIENVRESDLYYDSIMEAVYLDYDTYFEEI